MKEKIKYLKILLPISFLLFFSCDNDDEIVATAFGENLYMSDLKKIVPEKTSPNDSIYIVQQYAKNWIRQQVFLEHAKNNLSGDQMDFENKVRNYKNSLILYAFENQLLQDKLDTVVESSKINEYYDNHKEEFKLKENIVKVTYVKVPRNAPDKNQIRRLYRSTDPEDLVKLENYCTQHAATYFIDSKSWLQFNEIKREVPIQTSNQENFLRNNQNIEISDDHYRYFLYIHDYKLKGSISPLSSVKGDIKNIILNRRKQEFIKKYRNELYRKAIKSNKIEKFI